ncbi:MAG: hypothetical protein AB8G14_01010 [Ilumatobacter sp.]
MIETARQLADGVLAPMAEEVDQSTIPMSHLSALASAGLFSLDGLSPSDARRVMAAIAGGCGATFFVWVQHHGVRRTLTESGNHALRATLAEPLRTGQLLAGTAFAHVRRAGRPAVSATRIDGGWSLTGTAPWATSWGFADRFCVAAENADGQMVWAMLPGNGGPGVNATPLHLPVFAATGTVALHFDGCEIADDHIALVSAANQWRKTDRRRAALGQPAVLGVAERAIRLLRDSTRADDEHAERAADRLDVALTATWNRDDELIELLADDTADESKLIGLASAHRAACLDVGQRSTRALLAAVGGQGMDLAHPAQRLAREANFYVIQAQTADGRAATLQSV